MITGIGSLPYKSAESAIKYSKQHPVPFLPELPDVDGSMLDWIEHPEGLACLEYFKEPIYGLVKLECVGPLTLSLNRPYTTDEAIMKIVDCIGILTEGLCASRILFSLDEPALHGLQTAIDYESLWDVIFGEFSHLNLVSWMHTCADKSADWDKLLRSNIDILSFDASKNNILLYEEAYRERRDRGGKIAWGINRQSDVKDFQPGDFLTLPCGMSSYPIEDCLSALAKLKKIARNLSS